LGLIQWAQSPWGIQIPTHIAWGLLWVCAVAASAFLVIHAIYVGYWVKSTAAHSARVRPSSSAAASLPERVARHSLGARLFHAVMSVAMFALLLTAFLPKVGIQFPWVTYHWIAGIVLTLSIVYHIIHATFVLDFWSIWPDQKDIEDASRRIKQALGQTAPDPGKFAKYPLENKLYHLTILLTGLSVVGTGLFMMKRVQTPFFTRNPYLFSDVAWGWIYVLHGLAGVGLVGLIIVHIYFAVRPEKQFLTRSMIFGWISRDQYLEHYDPQRWPVDTEPESGRAPSREVPA
jgi:cytochrome b subunit of formate dehydrogenase